MTKNGTGGGRLLRYYQVPTRSPSSPGGVTPQPPLTQAGVFIGGGPRKPPFWPIKGPEIISDYFNKLNITNFEAL